MCTAKFTMFTEWGGLRSG